MSDNCADLSARLDALEAAINAIPKVDTNSIIAQAVSQARSVIEPLIKPGAIAATAGAIALVRTTALDAEAKANIAEAAAQSAAGEAAGAASTASGAASTAGAALSKALAVGALVAGILASIASLEILGGRIDALEAQIQSVASSVSYILGKLLGLQQGIQNALNQSNKAEGDAQNALRQAQSAQAGADKANNDIKGLQGLIADIKKGLTQLANYIAAISTIANEAEAEASRALDLAQGNEEALGGYQSQLRGVRALAQQAESDAQNAQQAAQIANLLANKASLDSDTALGKINSIAPLIPPIQTTAGEALNKANQALARSPLQGIPGKDGQPGRNGIDGRNGVDGAQGLQGVPGKDGRNGIPGTIGIPGTPGRDGLPGKDGKNGINGINGINGKDGKDGDTMDAQDKQNLINIGSALAGLTLLVNNRLPMPLTASNLQNSAAAGVCQSTKPGGCMSNALQGQANNINNAIQQSGNDLLNKINSGVLAAQTTLLTTINNKLGAFIPGGISGFLTTFKSAFDLFQSWNLGNKAMEYINLILTIQIAFQLTEGLGTLTSQTISNALEVVGLKDPNGKPFDIGQFIETPIANFIDNLFHAPVTDAVKLEWQTANKIFNSAANVLNAVQGMMWSVFNAFNVIGSWNAQIGNALKKYGVVGNLAFPWMNPAPNFHNKVFTLLFDANNILSQINIVAQTVLSTRTQIDSTEKQFDELASDLKKVVNTPVPDNDYENNQYITAVKVSKSPAPSAAQLAAVSGQ